MGMTRVLRQPNERRTTLLWLVMIGYLGLALLYSVVNPLFEAPDEIWHYEYARWIAAGKGLARPEDIPSAPWKQEGSQPPLYYLLAAALTLPVDANTEGDGFYFNPHAAIGDATSFGNRNRMLHGDGEAWPWRGTALAAHLMRFLSILLGGITVLSTHFTAKIAFPGWPAVALLAAGLVAFNPQFLFLNAAINNDNLVTAVAAFGVWLCCWLVSRTCAPELRWWAATGLVLGLAALSKLSGLLLGGLAISALSIWAWRTRSLRYWAQGAALMAGMAFLVAAWWYWRNWQLFGDPLALAVMFAVLPGRSEPATFAQVAAMAPGIWRSFWAVFGWFNVVVDRWVYAVYALLTVTAWGGWGVGAVFLRREIATSVRMAPLAFLLLWAGALSASLVRWAQISYPQGRLLFPAIGAFACMMAGGLWLASPMRWRSVLSMTMMAALVALALFIPFRWIAPIYAPPALLPASEPVPNPLSAPFGEHIRLVGYALERSTAQPGDAIDLTLYWQTDAPLTKNYSVFVHATDEVGILQAQRDAQPGLGNLPTSRWQAGAATGMVTEIRTVPDQHRLTIPATAYAPARLRIDVGLYDAADGRRLAAGEGDFVTVGYVDLVPHPAVDGIPNRTEILFGDRLALLGFEQNRRVLQAGETVQLALWWEVLAPMEQDYVVFVHLLAPPDAVWAQEDRALQAQDVRTSGLSVGTRWQESYELALPPTAPPGVYSVQIGVYDPETFARLQVNFSDAGVEIGRVRVNE